MHARAVLLALLLAAPLAWAAAEPTDALQDDAGSGADAPDAPSDAVLLASGRVYQGNTTVLDMDWYGLSLRAGQMLEVRIFTPYGSYFLLDPHGVRREVGIISALAPGEIRTPVDLDGVWHLRYDYPYPHTYFIGVGVDEPAPAPFALDLASPDALVLPTDAGPAGANAVVGDVDGGFNPYHVALRDDSEKGWTYPGAYLPDYPGNATALHLTFHEATLADSIRADCAEWEKVEPGRLYWIPGTKIVGLMTLSPRSITCADPTPRGLFGSEHGTLTASRAVGNGIGACPTCRLAFVSDAQPLVRATDWASRQPWIDVQANTWTPFPVVFTPTPVVSPVELPIYGQAGLRATPEMVRTIEAAASRMPTFFSTEDGVENAVSLAGHPMLLAPQATPSVIRVGAHDNGKVASWSGVPPHVVADGCDGWSATDKANEGYAPTGFGTSSSTPYVAGLAARALLEARAAVGDPRTGVHDGVLVRGAPTASGPLADGVVRVAELREAFLHAAQAPAASPEDGGTCAPGSQGTTPVQHPGGAAEVALLGYGAATKESARHAARILVGAEPMPERPVEDAFFALDATAVQVVYAAESSLP